MGIELKTMSLPYHHAYTIHCATMLTQSIVDAIMYTINFQESCMHYFSL